MEGNKDWAHTCARRNLRQDRKQHLSAVTPRPQAGLLSLPCKGKTLAKGIAAGKLNKNIKYLSFNIDRTEREVPLNCVVFLYMKLLREKLSYCISLVYVCSYFTKKALGIYLQIKTHRSPVPRFSYTPQEIFLNNNKLSRSFLRKMN